MILHDIKLNTVDLNVALLSCFSFSVSYCFLNRWSFLENHLWRGHQLALWYAVKSWKSLTALQEKGKSYCLIMLKLWIRDMTMTRTLREMRAWIINRATGQEVRGYLEQSPMVVKKVFPSIINAAVKKYELSRANLVRSVSVLYQGGISSKKQYNRKRRCAIFEVDCMGKNIR